jgi:3-oxoacyl-[acyl-carrier-protein] synthase III
MIASPPIGIAGVAVEVGDRPVSVEEFSEASDLPLAVVLDKLGFKQLLRWGDGPGPDDAALRVCVRALGGLDPRELGAIITLMHPNHGEQEVHGYGTLLKERLGATRAEVLDVADTCASVTLALQLARDLLAAEPELRHVLVVGVVVMLDGVDLSNPTTLWMANISDGAGAILVSRNPDLDNVLLATAHACDASFIDDVLSTSPYAAEPATYRARFRRLLPRRVEVPDKDGFKRRLDKLSQPMYIQTIRDALAASGFRPDQLDLVGANTMKPSMWRGILDAFKLDPATQMYHQDKGHVAFLDQFLCLQQVREERRLPQGGVLALSTAGVGFHWTATVIAFKGPRVEGSR